MQHLKKKRIGVRVALTLALSLGLGCGGDPNGLSNESLIYGQVTGGVVNSRMLGLRFPSHMSVVGSKLFIVDNGGERILGYSSLPNTNQVAPTLVLGQSDNMTDVRNNGGLSAKTLASPQNVVSDGTRLFATDRLNNRVLIWNSIPNSTYQAADIVLGQPNMTSAVANNSPGQAGVPSARSLFYPTGIFVKDGRLFVADSFNHRILIWNSIPTSNQQAADVVVGQANMTTRYGGTSNVSMAYPNGIFVTGTQMIVADSGNSRVLIWNSIPSNPATDNFKQASIYLGQPNFSGSAPNNGGIIAQSMFQPSSVYSDGTRLFVTDTGNNRVLIWNTIPSSTTADQRAAANLVLGQPGLTSNTANNGGVSAQSLWKPYGVFIDGTTLYVADCANHRILIWSALPTVNQESASKVLGQPDFTSGLAMNPGGISGADLSAPRSYILTAGNKAIVADSQLNRVLIWNTRPSGTYAAADVVVGQPNMTSYTANNGGISAKTLSFAATAYSDGTKLYVADRDNHRVLIWNSIPTTNFTAADVVLGQPNFTSNTPQNSPAAAGGAGVASAQSLWYPNSVYVNGGKLFVSDTGNSRVLIWNSIPTTNQAAASTVVGQQSMGAVGGNNGGLSAKTLAQPQGVFVNSNKLIVCDFGNNRVLIFNSVPSQNGKAANTVLGQPNMTSNAANNGGLGAKTMSNPIKAFSNGSVLGIADYANHRVLLFKPVPNSDQVAAVAVLGQTSFTSNAPNYNGVTAVSLARPGDIWFDASRIIVVDTGNDRIVDSASASVLP